MNLKGGDPEKFGAFRSFIYHWVGEARLAPLHRRIVSEIPIADGRLLDIGCGPGSLDRLLAVRRPALSVVGLDESEEMMRWARKKDPLPNLEFRAGSVQALSSRDEFDFALSVLSFHHWEEPEAGLEAVHRALKPGGRFWIYEGNPEAPRGDLRRDQGPLLGFLRTPVWLVRKCLRGHGFTVAEIESVIRPAVARTSFRTCEASPSGSLLRISLKRAA